MKILTLQLTCADSIEAGKITETLLSKRLVACVKQTTVSSVNHWEGKVESAAEVLLIMETTEENFADIEAEVRKIHSYETFVLLGYPVTHVSMGVEEWLKQNVLKS